MPDVTELLSQDHRTVEQLFAQFESTKDYAIAQKICEELTVHATVEEEIVYPQLQKIDAELEKHAEEEHDEAKTLIAKIRNMAADDAQLAPTVLKLKESVEHHVEEEEGKAWPQIRSELADRLDTLGTKVEERKQQLIAAGPAAITEQILLDLTKEELYAKAQEFEIEGRSDMTKEQLAKALAQQT
ncbi:MAG TPA: hemerythrin domain-containing protein [Acidimicrobiales bacterium]